ncbi:MAG: type II toxin-antitoxin system HicB family antitoxin [Bacteroidales bacterium]|nr:type II toxin-antitoxin system HicB family antitoxin [Bacteroidales bacterium]
MIGLLLKMNTLNAIIECSENNFAAYIEGLDGIVATGSNIQEIKKNLSDAIAVFIEACKEVDCELPDVLREEYKIEYRMDVKTLLNLLQQVFTKAGLERLTGINQKQLWHYAKGTSAPRKAQIIKIENAIHQLGNALISINL